MDEYTDNNEQAEELFHEIVKCAKLIHASMHHNFAQGFCHRGQGEGQRGIGGGRHKFGGDFQKIGQIRLLVMMLEKDGISQKDLAEILQITPASISELLCKIEAESYIERKQNEEDKRVTNIFLTEKGRNFAEEMKKNKSEIIKNVFLDIDETEQKNLLELIKKVNSSLNSKIKGNQFCAGINCDISNNCNYRHMGQGRRGMHNCHGY